MAPDEVGRSVRAGEINVKRNPGLYSLSLLSGWRLEVPMRLGSVEILYETVDSFYVDTGIYP